MKMYVCDLKPGDSFDLAELIERQGFHTLEILRRLAAQHSAVVKSCHPVNIWDLYCIRFKLGSEVIVWNICQDQYVVMKGW